MRDHLLGREPTGGKIQGIQGLLKGFKGSRVLLVRHHLAHFALLLFHQLLHPEHLERGFFLYVDMVAEIYLIYDFLREKNMDSSIDLAVQHILSGQTT